MSWLNNTAAKIYITIDGNDYSNELISGQITDSSAINTGAVLTGGLFEFADQRGNVRLEDYNQTKFGRGKIVLIDIEIQGERKRHPRGYLYILGSTYNMEARTLSLETGCILTLHNITDEIGDMESFSEFPLVANDEEVPTFSNLLTSVNTEGKFLWQDSQGTVNKEAFFEGDGLGSSKAEAEWVSVRDYTCLSVGPLGVSSMIPDQIKVNYTWTLESDTDTGEDPVTGKPQEEDFTESTYWLEHPANLRKKQKVCTTDPRGNQTCRDVMVNTAKRQYSVTKTTASRRTYGATGGSVSVENEVIVGPAVEMNGAYYAELYAFQLAQNDGNPNGVSPAGLDNITQQSKERTYEYGTGGEVTKTVEKQYKNLLGAMTTNDWRAGNSETGLVYNPEDAPSDATRGFLTSPPKALTYLHSLVTTEYTYYDDRTVQLTTTTTSSAGCNGVGIYPPTGDRITQDISAENNGITTSVKRTSTGGLLNPDQPPRNPGGKAVTTKSDIYLDESTKYLPTEAGNVILSSNLPFAVPNASEQTMRTYAANYARTLRRQLEGDAAGVRVAETIRPEIFNYKPGMPFSFFDKDIEKLLKLRMNSTAWAIAPGQAIFSTEGCFIGESNGTVVIPDNTDPTVAIELAKVVTEKKKETAAAQEIKDETQVVKDEAQVIKDDAQTVKEEIEAVRDDKAQDSAQADADETIDRQQLAGAEDTRDADQIIVDDALIERDNRDVINDAAQLDKVTACSADPDSLGCQDATAAADIAQANLDAANVALSAAQADLAIAEDEVVQKEYDLSVSEQEAIDAAAELAVAEGDLVVAEGDLTNAEEDLGLADDALTLAEQELAEKEVEQEEAEEAYQEVDEAIEQPPSVEGETVIDAGGDGADITEFISVELTIGIGPNATGNGNDGIGVVFDWSVPEELRFNTNALIFVSGEKVTKDASILEQDLTGTIPEDGNGSLLVTTEEVIIPDLFDPNVQRNPDEVFEVLVAAAPVTDVFRVRVFAKPADQIFDVKSSATPPDQVFDVTAVKTFDVTAAQLPFIVEVGPELPFQIFDVTTMATPADQIFEVTRGPEDAFQNFLVLAGTTFDVSTSWGIPYRIFDVELGAPPAADPDVTYGVSVGGSDAPPIPEPDATFVVSTSYASPDRIFGVKAITNHIVEVFNRFEVNVFAEPADQVFDVTTSAKAFDQIFNVQVGPAIPNQIFETLIVNEFDVTAYDAFLGLNLQEAEATPGNFNYVVSGQGFNFADSPTLELTVGQQFRFQVNVPANTVWIKKDQETGPGEIDPYWGDLQNQGIQNGFLYFRPWEPGTYYYQSEFDANVFGQINVTGDGAPEPDQIFDVFIGADPDGYNEIFEVLVGPEQPFKTYVTTVEGGAPIASQIFEVKTWAEKADQVFETRVSEAPITYNIQSNGSSSYAISGGDIPDGTFVNNATITIQVGQVLEFLVNASGHPVWIKDAATTGSGQQDPDWVEYIVGQGTQLGSMRAQFNSTGTFYYVCEFHGSMQGQIIVEGQDDGPLQHAVGVDGTNYSIEGGRL